MEHGHRTLVITRTGGKVVTITLASRTARAIDLASGGRWKGAIFLGPGRPHAGPARGRHHSPAPAGCSDGSGASAGEGNGPVDYPVGSHGTVIQRDPSIEKGSGSSPSGMDRYLVAMEGRRMSLIVDGMDIERIYGRAKVIKDAQGEICWEQIFRNGDQVRLRESFTNNGQLYEARREGRVFFGDLATPAIVECWATGYYPVTLSDGLPNLGRVAFKVPANSLDLAVEGR